VAWKGSGWASLFCRRSRLRAEEGCSAWAIEGDVCAQPPLQAVGRSAAHLPLGKWLQTWGTSGSCRPCRPSAGPART
jgi:hypothetical protein